MGQLVEFGEILSKKFGNKRNQSELREGRGSTLGGGEEEWIQNG